MCELAAHPEVFQGKRIRVTANLVFGRHGVMAYGPSCPAVAFEYDETPRFRQSPEWDELSTAVYSRESAPTGSLGPSKDFQADIIARFDWRVQEGDRDGDESVRPGPLTVRQIHSFRLVDRAYADEYKGAMDNCILRATLGRELEIARKACDRAVELRGTGRSHFLAGLVALDDRRFADARPHFDAAYFKNRDNHLALYGRGIANQRLGRGAEAVRDLYEARRVSSAGPATDPAGAYFEIFRRFDPSHRK